MKNSRLLALGVAVMLALWMASGLLRDDGNDGDDAVGDEHGNATADPDEGSLMRVEVSIASPTTEQRTVSLRGTVAALRTVELRAETAGRVLAVDAERGGRIAAGAPLLRLDTGVRGAALTAARARLLSADAASKAAQSLSRRGLQAQLQTDQTRAEASLAQADVDRLEREISDATVRAPFAALIERLPLELGQLVERGDPVALLVDDSAFEVHATAAQRTVHQLQPGQRARITLLDGQMLDGTLTWIGSVADPASRSFAVEARIDDVWPALAQGLSATLDIEVEELEATYLSPATLALNSEGELGVKILDDEDRVHFVPVTLLRTSLDGAWASGIDAGMRIITQGQGFVAEGERVIATPADAGTTG